jgi:hypothetical protein
MRPAHKLSAYGTPASKERQLASEANQRKTLAILIQSEGR